MYEKCAFQAGDLVSRDGSDVHRVLAIDDDLIDVECVKAPSTGWCKVGDRDRNMIWRYNFAGKVIDG